MCIDAAENPVLMASSEARRRERRLMDDKERRLGEQILRRSNLTDIPTIQRLAE